MDIKFVFQVETNLLNASKANDWDLPLKCFY